MKKITFISFIALVFISTTIAQPRRELISVVVAPDHLDWTYSTGEKVKFNVQVLQNGNPIPNVEINYEVKQEMMSPIESKTITLKDGTATIDAGTMKKPGFLRCWVKTNIDGKEYTGYATAGFNPEKIQPSTTLPDDFEEFWSNAKEELAKVPVEATVTLMPDRCTEKVNVYHVGIDNVNRSKIYGILCVPKKPGKYPAILRVPGAGIWPHYGNISQAEEGFVTLEIGIHGIPVNLDRQVYSNLGSGALSNYWITNLDDKDNYYYKRVYLGCVRAVDYIFSLDEFDGENIGVTGGSQGGALSIITTGLDSRIKYLAAFYPALSDLTGYLDDRAGGWPHMFTNDFTNKPEKIETSKYYDVVNFARFVKVPGLYSWGYNDNVCPPTSMYSAYNVIEASKDIYLVQETGHWTYPEQLEKLSDWLVKKLKEENRNL